MGGYDGYCIRDIHPLLIECAERKKGLCFHEIRLSVEIQFTEHAPILHIVTVKNKVVVPGKHCAVHVQEHRARNVPSPIKVMAQIERVIPLNEREINLTQGMGLQPANQVVVIFKQRNKIRQPCSLWRNSLPGDCFNWIYT